MRSSTSAPAASNAAVASRSDQGLHRFRHAPVPGAGIGDAVREGWRINLPPRRRPGAGSVAPLVTADQDAVAITAVKLADDGSGDVVVRCHEAHGGRAAAVLTTGFPASGVQVTDLPGRPLPDPPDVRLDGDRIAVRLRPFELMTLRLRRARPGSEVAAPGVAHGIRVRGRT